CARTAYCFDYW
nr:immunoglobulin heavy chain junction region [Mus musculus]MBK4198316.1 immunoglobulin heavy chain junction region [Mus musculus]